MPWLSEAMKDVISCDKLRGGANIIKECVDEFEYKFKDSETGKIKKFKITEKSFCRGQALKPMEKEKYIYLQS